MAQVVNRADGRVDPGARTEYPARPTAGHRPLPPHEVARRRQVEINGDTGLAVFDAVNDALERAGIDRSHPDATLAHKHAAMGVALGSHLRAAEPFAGYMSAGEHTYTRLRGPHAMLEHLLLGR